MDLIKNLTVIHFFKLAMFSSYLVFVLLIAAYNWLYLSRTLSSNSEIGLYPPSRIESLVKISTVIALVTALCIFFFLATGIY